MTQFLRVRAPAAALSGSNLGQVVHTHVPLSPSSISWYWPMGGDALFGREGNLAESNGSLYRQVDGLKPPAR